MREDTVHVNRMKKSEPPAATVDATFDATFADDGGCGWQWWW